jgi:capsular polysaccharide transport system permease protein
MDMVTTKQDGKISLPQKITPSQVPAEISKDKDMSPVERRALEVSQIQKDLGRRRRRNIFFLTLRLIAFILMPTFIAGYYYAFVASPMYSTKSSFQIIKSGGGAGGLGGMLAGTGFATTTEAIAVQTFLMSKTAMIRLDEDAGFKQHFSAPNIDPIHQLEPNATNESAFKVYKKRLKIGFDPTEGMVNMEVITADPQTGVEFSNALITYGEEVVDGLSARSKENQVADAKKALDEAMEERRLAQESLIDLQSSTMLDPEAYAGSLRGQISSLE